MFAMYKSTKYILNNNIPGENVECVVWKGGSMMICIYTLILMRENTKKLHLYDTYEGMSTPTPEDIRISDNKTAKDIMSKKKRNQKDYFILL